MKPIKVGLLGLGTVGSGVVKIIETHQSNLQHQVGVAIEIEKVLIRDLSKERKAAVPMSKLTTNADEVVEHPDIDVIIEVMGGVSDTKLLLEKALAKGKHIVTANKDLMAEHGSELLTLARERGCDVFYEASVAGGIPILRSLTDSLSSDRITKIMGIVNGTTNYMLTKMSNDGTDYEDILREAQELGYAEADPTADVGGLDAARKMAILGRLGFHLDVALEHVRVRGISDITSEDISYGKRLGYEMKLLGIAEREDDMIHVTVEPTMVKNTHPLASVGGVYNAVYVYGEAVGEIMFYGPGAGDMPTATSVVADLVAAVKNLQLGVSGRTVRLPDHTARLKSDDQIFSKVFLLLEVVDRSGVLAKITQAFAEEGVSLESILQQPVERQLTDAPSAELILITHQASKASMDQVLKRFATMDVVHHVKSCYRVES